MKRTIIMILAVLCALVVQAQYNLLPAPRQLTEKEGTCTYSDDKVTVEMVTEIAGATDYAVEGFGNQAYRLVVAEDGITIQAVDPDGVLNAKATLRQLAENCGGAIPCMEIVDWPSFKVRGFMHDVGRDYITVEELKKELDVLARFKINYFHWHLTENQAWRFEVKAYPQLTDAAKMTRREGKFYTQAECREVIEYAKERGIMVVPEVDMPGHSEAFTRAMGFTMASEQGQAALETILDELAEVFAESPYIHIGADETTVTAAFVQRMTAKVHALGKKALTWNPINVGVTKANGIDGCQLWSREGGIVSGMMNIDSKYNYLNLNDVFADLVGIYNSNCFYRAEGSEEMAGGVACVWTDRILPTQKDIIEDNNFWATMLANAERLWQGGRTQYIEEAGCTLANSGEAYERFRDWEERFLYYKSTLLKDEPIPYVRQTNIRWRVTRDADFNLAELKNSNSQKLKNSQIVTGGTVYLNHTWPTNVPGLWGKNQAYGQTAYAWTYVYSETEQDAGALIEFQNYERSWHDGTAPAGQWDKKGSRLWLNDEELTAPMWQRAGQGAGFETLLLDENHTGRAPYAIHLKKGWNKVAMQLPYKSVSDIRLNRWMWTFVITTPDGRDALPGIIYSPDRMLDSEAEALSLYINTIEADVHSKVSDRIGYYRLGSAAALLAVIEDVKATLSESMSAEQRAAQHEAIEAAYADFLANYQSMGVNLPQSDRYYTLCTPQRAGRYVSCSGTLTSTTAVGESNLWQFEQRADGTYNIRCMADGHYISPASAHNTAIKTTADEPAAGWALALADELGYMIITSGTYEDGCQLNQTGNSPFNVFNWYHKATEPATAFNTTDTGCKFVIADAPHLPVSTINYSDASRAYYYNIYTPNRGNRYPTSYGDGEDIVGQTTVSDASAWKFVKRDDGTCDIVNFADQTYISPASAHNTSLKTVAEQPEAGWTLQHDGTYWFIYSGGTAQFNQTNNATLGFKVYNWFGNNGTPNTTDTGCQYLIVEADVEESGTPDAILTSNAGQDNVIYSLSGHRVATTSRPGLYIVRSQGRSQKLMVK